MWSGILPRLGEKCKLINRTNQTKDRSFASLLKLDHVIYIQNGYIALGKGIDSDEAKAVASDHYNCRLDKWYYQGEGYENVRGLPA